MKKNLKGLISLFICIIMLLSVSVPVFATNKNNSNSLYNSKGFKDVKKDHWAYDNIMWMFEKNIINGVGNNCFNPEGTVTRAEFAKMMVNTLNLEKYSPETPSFLDVKKKNWEYPYVEGAKTYLTGFRASNGDYFKPSQTAVREDMAVALVKALGYQNEAADESILNTFTDAGQISPNLRKYVALSVKYGLILGDTKNGQSVFDPQGNLTRAQAATLLYRAFKNNEEKVTYDEDKVTYDENTYVKPAVTVGTENGVTVVRWNKIASDKFKEYRVVISKNDSAPKYPDEGYLCSITDSDRTYAVIDNNTQYTSGDFGNYLTKGEHYYFSVTAVYKDGKTVAGNSVRFQYDGAVNPEQYVMPVLSASEVNGRLVLTWNKINSTNLVGYKVVASKADSTPSYPENGYLYYYTDRNRNYAVIDNQTAYTNGDFNGYFVKGEKYYFSITAVYNDRSITGNVLQLQYDGQDSSALYPAPVVSAAYENGKLIIKWNKIDSSKLKEYRLVISQNNQTPAYPANGWYNTAYAASTTSAAVEVSVPYTSGDFTTLTYGNEYYFSVTAVYDDNKYVAGNAVKVLYLVSPNQ